MSQSSGYKPTHGGYSPSSPASIPRRPDFSATVPQGLRVIGVETVWGTSYAIMNVGTGKVAADGERVRMWPRAEIAAEFLEGIENGTHTEDVVVWRTPHTEDLLVRRSPQAI